MFYRLLPLTTLALLLAGGCATFTAETCPTVDWREQGYTAGRSALPLETVTKAERKCADYGITANAALFTAGWEEGLADFCTPLGVFDANLERETPTVLCRDDTGELDELAALAAGHRATAARYHEAERALEDLHSTIERRTRRIAKRRSDIADLRARLEDAPDAARPEILHAIEKYRDQIAKARRRRLEAEDKLARAESDLRVLTPAFDDSRAFVRRTRARLGGV